MSILYHRWLLFTLFPIFLSRPIASAHVRVRELVALHSLVLFRMQHVLFLLLLAPGSPPTRIRCLFTFRSAGFCDSPQFYALRCCCGEETFLPKFTRNVPPGSFPALRRFDSNVCHSKVATFYVCLPGAAAVCSSAFCYSDAQTGQAAHAKPFEVSNFSSHISLCGLSSFARLFLHSILSLPESIYSHHIGPITFLIFLLHSAYAGCWWWWWWRRFRRCSSLLLCC